MEKKHIFTILLAFSVCNALAQEVFPLYKGVIPNNNPCDLQEKVQKTGNGKSLYLNVTEPSLTVFIPDTQDEFKTAILICPGGAYHYVSVDYEGVEAARAFNAIGITAFVLKYRIPCDACMDHKELVPLEDAQQAMKMIKENAMKWDIDMGKVGVLGFSAGGHLASTLSTKYNDVQISNSEKTNLRPSFTILAYPVISMMNGLTHKGSQNNLLGKNPSIKKQKQFSSDMNVTKETPIAFLVHGSNDSVVVVNNSVNYYQALCKNKVAAEMHLFQNGAHGFGINKDRWVEKAGLWLKQNNLLKGNLIKQ